MQAMALRVKGRLGTHEALQKNAAAYNSGLKVLRDAPNCKRCPGNGSTKARGKRSGRRRVLSGLQRLDVAMFGALDGQGHERGRHGRDGG